MAGPSVIVFDVNETLSDMSPLSHRFAETGAPAELAKLWFATLLRDGFALAAAGDARAFAEIGRNVLMDLLPGEGLTMAKEEAADHVLAGFQQLALHPDVAGGVSALQDAGYRLVTLSNGSAQVAEKLFSAGGIRDRFERLLSVEDAPAWKPAPSSYRYAAEACGTAPGEMLLVAVHPWDLHGAARAGLGTAWLNRTGAAYPGHFAAPDIEITALTELPAALEGQTR